MATAVSVAAPPCAARRQACTHSVRDTDAQQLLSRSPDQWRPLKSAENWAGAEDGALPERSFGDSSQCLGTLAIARLWLSARPPACSPALSRPAPSGGFPGQLLGFPKLRPRGPPALVLEQSHNPVPKRSLRGEKQRPRTRYRIQRPLEGLLFTEKLC